MNKEIKSNILKLQGKAELPKEIETGSNYHISLEGSVVSKTISDNDDGSFNQVFVFKPVKIDLLDEKGESSKLKDTRSNSQLLRSLIWKKWVNLASDKTFDETYDKLIHGIMRDIDELIDRYV